MIHYFGVLLARAVSFCSNLYICIYLDVSYSFPYHYSAEIPHLLLQDVSAHHCLRTEITISSMRHFAEAVRVGFEPMSSCA